MLNKARSTLEKLLDALGVARVPLKPNTITVLALMASALVPVLAYFGAPLYVTALALLATASLDGLDGYIARKRGLQSSFGAFLDSTVDRVSDSLYTCSIAIAGIADAVAAFAILTSEYVVSYTRARAETLGVNLAGVGLMERGERTILKAAILLTASFDALAARALTALLLVLTAATAIQRVIVTKRLLEKPSVS